MRMTRAGMTSRLAAGAAAAIVAIAIVYDAEATAGAENDTVKLLSHRAVYDLKLAKSTGKRSIESVRGRILYDFTGSACEGYTLQFRQVSELDTGEDKVAVSDLRANTWEAGDAKSFRFSSENYLNDTLQESVDGRAERGQDGVAATLTRPSEKSFKLDAGMVFPTEHVRRAIVAARAGKSILEFPVYDGSENGEKIYNSLTVIGHPIPPDKKPTDIAANEPALAGLTRWPVTISYFDKAAAGGEQTPVYAIGFELYENGVSRNLLLDYGDFTVSGEMTQFEVKDAKPCEPPNPPH
jgi:hypothetical protein